MEKVRGGVADECHISADILARPGHIGWKTEIKRLDIELICEKSEVTLYLAAQMDAVRTA